MYYWDNHIPNIYLKNDLCMILVNYFKPKIDIFYLCSVLLEHVTINMFKSYYLGEWKTQTDGMPRAGVVPKEIAENNGVSYSLNTYLY